jgi:hypothetical protein
VIAATGIPPIKFNGFNHLPGTKSRQRWLNPLNFLGRTFENIKPITLYLPHALKKKKSKKKVH